MDMYFCTDEVLHFFTYLVLLRLHASVISVISVFISQANKGIIVAPGTEGMFSRKNVMTTFPPEKRVKAKFYDTLLFGTCIPFVWGREDNVRLSGIEFE